MHTEAKVSPGASGFSLTELMAAMVILAIAALGALGYQYHAARHAKIAEAQITATRTAQLLLEDWKSTGGSDEYNPSNLNLGFSSGISVPSDWDTQGSALNGAVYNITIDDIPMVIMLSWNDVANDPVAQVTLRQLTVMVRFGEAPQQGGGAVDVSNAGSLGNMEPLILTTYIRLDASGG